MTAISCSTGTSCAAVDTAGKAVTWDGKSWSKPVEVDPGAALTSVSCSDPSWCVAVDDRARGEAVTWNGTDWSSPAHVIPRSSPGYVSAVSCPESSVCAAADTGGTAVTLNGSAWAVVSGSPIPGALSVSCPDRNSCVLVGQNGDATLLHGI
jgi:hypothetical protein